MPIYEYHCRDCRKISDFLVLNRDEPFTPVCRACGSQALERVLSRVNVRLSEESRLERLADPGSCGSLDENDPRTVARMLKKLGQEMGEDAPGEVDQLVEEVMAEGGQAGRGDAADGEI